MLTLGRLASLQEPSTMPSRQTRLQNAERDGRFVDSVLDPMGVSPSSSEILGFAPVPEGFYFSHLRYRCAECGAKEDLQQCARCKKVKYCGRECQVSAYRRIHKTVCCKPNQLGYPSMALIEQADSSTLASMLEEWVGSDIFLCAAVATQIMQRSQIMDVASATRMAKTTARILDSIEDLENSASRRKALFPLFLANALASGCCYFFHTTLGCVRQTLFGQCVQIF